MKNFVLRGFCPRTSKTMCTFRNRYVNTGRIQFFLICCLLRLLFLHINAIQTRPRYQWKMLFSWLYYMLQHDFVKYMYIFKIKHRPSDIHSTTRFKYEILVQIIMGYIISISIMIQTMKLLFSSHSLIVWALINTCLHQLMIKVTYWTLSLRDQMMIWFQSVK